MHLATHSSRHIIPAPGIAGGGNGGLSKLVLNYDSPEPVVLPREATSYPLKKGDVVTVFAGGGAGYGNPLEREPRAVLDDVRNEKVSPQRARDVYGVAIDTVKRNVLEDETARLRRRVGGSQRT